MFPQGDFDALQKHLTNIAGPLLPPGFAQALVREYPGQRWVVKNAFWFRSTRQSGSVLVMLSRGEVFTVINNGANTYSVNTLNKLPTPGRFEARLDRNRYEFSVELQTRPVDLGPAATLAAWQIFCEGVGRRYVGRETPAATAAAETAAAVRAEEEREEAEALMESLAKGGG